MERIAIHKQCRETRNTSTQTTSNAFDKIAAGLRDAIDYVEGRESGVVVHRS